MNENENYILKEKNFLARKRPFSYMTKIMVRKKENDID